MSHEERIWDVIETLLANWREWDGHANQQAQQDQDPQSYRDEMFQYLYPLLDGLVSP